MEQLNSLKVQSSFLCSFLIIEVFLLFKHGVMYTHTHTRTQTHLDTQRHGACILNHIKQLKLKCIFHHTACLMRSGSAVCVYIKQYETSHRPSNLLNKLCSKFKITRPQVGGTKNPLSTPSKWSTRDRDKKKINNVKGPNEEY